MCSLQGERLVPLLRVPCLPRQRPRAHFVHFAVKLLLPKSEEPKVIVDLCPSSTSTRFESNADSAILWAHNLVPVPSKPLHRAPDPPAARVMTRRISLGAAAPPIPINTRNTRDCIQSQNQVTNTINQSQHVASNTESAQGRHHHIGIPEPQRDINISLCHWIATTPVVPGRHAP